MRPYCSITFLLLIMVVLATKCPDDVDLSRRTFTRGYYYDTDDDPDTDEVISQIDTAVLGKDSIYAVQKVASEHCIWRRYFDGTLKWNYCYSLTNAPNLALTSDESSLLVIGSYSLMILSVNTSDGTIMDSAISTALDDCQTFSIDSDTTTLHLACNEVSSSYSTIVAINVEDLTTSAGYQTNIEAMAFKLEAALENIKISNENNTTEETQALAYYLSLPYLSSNYLAISKFYMDDYSEPQWSKRFECSAYACSVVGPASLYIHDSSKLYYFQSIDSTMFFFALSISDGSMIEGIFSPSHGFVGSKSSVMVCDEYSKKLYLLDRAIMNIYIYDLISQTFTEAKDLGTISVISIAATKGIIYTFGTSSSLFRGVYKSFNVKGTYDQNQVHAYEVSEYTMEATTSSLYLSGDSDVSLSSYTPPTLNSIVMTSSTYDTINDDPIFTFTSDFVFQDPVYEVIELIENAEGNPYSAKVDGASQLSKSLDVTCTYSGLKEFMYSQSGDLEWVTFNDDFDTVSFSTPKVDYTDTGYWHYQTSVETKFSNHKDYAVLEILVIPCDDDNCKYCTYANPSYCNECELWYSFNSDNNKCEYMTGVLAMVIICALLTVALFALICVNKVLIEKTTDSLPDSANRLKTLSYQPLWSIINQYQFYMLFLMLNLTLPSDIKTTLHGLYFGNFTLSFIDFMSIQKLFSDDFTFSQPNDSFDDSRMNYGSTTVNFLYLLLTLAFIVITHIILKTIRDIQNALATRKRRRVQNRIETRWSKISGYILKLLYGQLYIRIFLQCFTFLLLCIWSEYKYYDDTKSAKRVSLILSTMMLNCLVFLSVIIAYDTVKSLIYKNHGNEFINEIYNGVKKSRFAKPYTALLLIYRFIFIVIIMENYSSSYARISTIFVLQLLFGAYLIVFRPFVNLYENLIEIINQACLFVFSIFIIGVSDDLDWPTGYSTFIIVFIFGNLLSVLGFAGVMNILELIKCLNERKNAPTSTSVTQIRIQPSMTNKSQPTNQGGLMQGEVGDFSVDPDSHIDH